MAQALALGGARSLGAAIPAPAGVATRAPIPNTRPVRDLDLALRIVRQLGGSVTSETRTAPGIGSWAFVTDGDGNEVVLWEDAGRVPG